MIAKEKTTGSPPINFSFDVFIGSYIVHNDVIGTLKVNYMYSTLFNIKQTQISHRTYKKDKQIFVQFKLYNREVSWPIMCPKTIIQFNFKIICALVTIPNLYYLWRQNDQGCLASLKQLVKFQSPLYPTLLLVLAGTLLGWILIWICICIITKRLRAKIQPKVKDQKPFHINKRNTRRLKRPEGTHSEVRQSLDY